MNFTDHEKFIVEEIKSAFSTAFWFKKQNGSFGVSSVPFAEMLTKRGMAFTFNILDFDKLINMQMYVVRNGLTRIEKKTI